MEKPARNAGIDLLKLVAMLLVVVFHCVQTLGGLHPKLDVDQSAFLDANIATLDPLNIVLVFLWGLGALGNILFLLCSIWFLTSSKTTKYQKIFQLLLDTFFISILFLAGYLIGGSDLSFKEILGCLLPTCFANNWFVTCYLLLYLIHPLLNMALEHMSKRFSLHLSIILSTLYLVVCTVLPGKYFTNDLVIFVVIYIVVGSIQKWKVYALDKTSLNVVMIIGGLLGYTILILGSEFVGVRFGLFQDAQTRYASDGNIFLILIALGVFNLFRKMSFKSKPLAFLASHTLFIYLIHENILFRTYTRPLYYVWVYSTFGYSHVLGWMLLLAVCLYGGSMLISILYGQTLGRVTKAISGKLCRIKVFRPLE